MGAGDRVPILVLGLGSRLLMDDGVGIAVVEALAERPGSAARYEVVETDVDYGLALAEGATQIILVDAVAAGEEPGSVSVWRLSDLGPTGHGLSLHHAHLVDLLRQQDSAAGATLVGIEPYRVEFHWGLSAEMQKRFEAVVEQVAEIIERF